MRKRRLGDSDLEVSEISLGSWLTYSGGIERDQTEACTRAAFDAGINFFDTANVYGDGAAETRGARSSPTTRATSTCSRRRSSSRCRATDPGSRPSRSASRSTLSLERLQTDYVDLYQCHRFDADVPIEETMEALTEVVESGKARYIGFSEWTPEQIRAGLEVPGAAKFVSSQPQYSMLWRAPEAEVFALCAENGISQIVWSPLAEGVLTGKYEPGQPPPADSRAASDEMGIFIERYLRRRDARGRAAPPPDRRRGRADDGRSSRSPGSCAATSWPRAIIGACRARAGPRRTSRPPGWSSPRDVLEAIDEALGDVPLTGEDQAPGATPGVKHRSAGR